MPTLKDIKEVRRLKEDMNKLLSSYKNEKKKLNALIKEKRACVSSGYIQHYPEYNSMIGETLSSIKSKKKELRYVCNKLREVLYA